MNNRGGFTLLELLIVMGITLLLTSMAISYGRGSESRLALTTDQVSIAVSLSRAKSLTLGRMKTPDVSDDYESCAFGVYFDGNNNNFVIFQDLVNVEAGENCSKASNEYTYDGSSNETVRVVDLHPDVRFNFSGTRQVAFLPPFLNPASPDPLPLDIDLITRDGRSEAGITITGSGRVELR